MMSSVSTKTEMRAVKSFFDNVLRRTSQPKDISIGEQRSLRLTLQKLNTELKQSNLGDLSMDAGENPDFLSQEAVTRRPSFTPTGSPVTGVHDFVGFWMPGMTLSLQLTGILDFGGENLELRAQLSQDNFFAGPRQYRRLAWIYTRIVFALLFMPIICELMEIFFLVSSKPIIWVHMVPWFIKLCLALITPFIQYWLRRFLTRHSGIIHILHVLLTSMGGKDQYESHASALFCFACIFILIGAPTYEIWYRNVMQYAEVYSGQTLVEILQSIATPFVMLVYAQYVIVISSMCVALQFTVDAFSCRLISEGFSKVENARVIEVKDICDGWQLISALVRALSFSTQWSITVAMVFGSTIMFLAGYCAIVQGSWVTFMWGCILVCTFLLSLLLVRTSNLTSRCDKIPTIVNSLSKISNMDKMMLIHYLKSSSGGYTLFNEPINPYFVARVAYFVWVIFIFFFTQSGYQ
eukprot:gnl/MRDRNA2_/MRDRNA2_16765_c0_seq1.p1 gnl/MRDRNA2_/MRDRNA2_16765_c0~~gnl/MRDRNA2_/MRDRNA2_16765_c0_seq1.p1  ORF type:complete len:465 (+),score=45.75 gnl/MRDRNA2_/MRDRNA2_16765_c0_seq1:1-1395(+)